MSDHGDDDLETCEALFYACLSVPEEKRIHRTLDQFDSYFRLDRYFESHDEDEP